MKLCPTCGEVYPDRTTRCRAHDEELLDWAEVSETATGVPTAVDGDTGPFSDTAPLTSPGDLTDPEVPLHAAQTPPLSVVVDPSLIVATPKPSRVLGERYRLGQHIGIGGYGAVFDAYDERLDKRVAVKVLSPAVAQDAEVVRRFKREALAASRVRHECIVDVTDYDIDAAGISFIVMEYLDGFDLSEVIADDGPLPPLRALAIAAQCASALTAAHAAGIIHRDLKPANIFLVRSPSRPDFVKIIDFGISKLKNDDGQFSNVTDASKVVGTPFYMPPEQGQGKPLDGRTDVYALGIILFEMLTDERPFIGASALEILTNAMTQPRVPPSTQRPELAQIPGLDRLVLRAISADRDQRFDSMQQFGEAIMGCLSELDAARVLSLPAIVHDGSVSDSGRRSVPRLATPTELVNPTTLERSSGEITAPHLATSRSRWTIPALTTVLVAAALALWWMNRSAKPDVASVDRVPAPPAAAVEPRPVDDAVEPRPVDDAVEPPPQPDPASTAAPAAAPIDAGAPAADAEPEKPEKPAKHTHAKRRRQPRPRPRRTRRRAPAKQAAKQPAKPAIGIKDW